MSEEAAEIVLRQLDQVLCVCIETPEAAIVDYTFLEKCLLSASNSPPIPLPEITDTFLHSLLEQKARDDPAAVALEFLDDQGRVSTYTYDAFNQAANQVAHALLKYGVKRDDAIPVCMEKSPQYYICVLGILKAGSAFTPIDPSAPTQRKMFMLGELGARWVITNNTEVKGLPARDGLKFIILEKLDLGSYPVTNPIIEDLLPTHLAYRLYTSGMSSTPVGAGACSFSLPLDRLNWVTKGCVCRNQECFADCQGIPKYYSLDSRIAYSAICCYNV